MQRKPITQRFPGLLPLRRAQKKLFFYSRMHFDKNRYAITKAIVVLPVCVFEANTRLLNENTGFDMKYQHNKVYNLRLAAEPVNDILIHPGETFSFWQLVRLARKKDYREGLSLQYGKLVTVAGGGLCHLSNFLFWLFLHTPLTIVERHPHGIKDFPSPDESEPDGVDATVSEGWLDLKVLNPTNLTFQIQLEFDDDGPCLWGRILAGRDMGCHYDILNRDQRFFKRAGAVCERVPVYQRKFDLDTGQLLSETLLYTDVLTIGYPLPEGTPVSESE